MGEIIPVSKHVLTLLEVASVTKLQSPEWLEKWRRYAEQNREAQKAGVFYLLRGKEYLFGIDAINALLKRHATGRRVKFSSWVRSALREKQYPPIPPEILRTGRGFADADGNIITRSRIRRRRTESEFNGYLIRQCVKRGIEFTMRYRRNREGIYCCEPRMTLNGYSTFVYRRKIHPHRPHITGIELRRRIAPDERIICIGRRLVKNSWSTSYLYFIHAGELLAGTKLTFRMKGNPRGVVRQRSREWKSRWDLFFPPKN